MARYTWIRSFPLGYALHPSYSQQYIADALLWIMQNKGVSWGIHYIDDFLTTGAPNSQECQHNTLIMQSVYEEAGLPMEPSKSVGPTISLVFLGILIDTIEKELWLPQDKLADLQSTITQWRGRKACRKRELLSLIGSLSHACKVVWSGRTFLHRLIDLSTKVARLDHFIRLNAEAWADLEWWYQFIGPWNGVSLLSSLSAQTPEATIYSDASSSWGCGVIYQGHWFQLQWDKNSETYHISIKELLPIVIVTTIWGRHFIEKTILVRSDNVAAVAAINHQTSPVKEVALLLRCLAFIMARFNIRLQAAHIPGILNDIADALSRNNMSTFFSLVPQADKHPEIIPSSLIHLLIPCLPD